jgi:hypothetical protein
VNWGVALDDAIAILKKRNGYANILGISSASNQYQVWIREVTDNGTLANELW